MYRLNIQNYNVSLDTPSPLPHKHTVISQISSSDSSSEHDLEEVFSERNHTEWDFTIQQFLSLTPALYFYFTFYFLLLHGRASNLREFCSHNTAAGGIQCPHRIPLIGMQTCLHLLPQRNLNFRLMPNMVEDYLSVMQ